MGRTNRLADGFLPLLAAVTKKCRWETVFPLVTCRADPRLALWGLRVFVTVSRGVDSPSTLAIHRVTVLRQWPPRMYYPVLIAGSASFSLATPGVVAPAHETQ